MADAPISPRFGVEIEFVEGPEPAAIVRALEGVGLAARFEDYNHHTREHWKLTTDSSCGLELVSPPLYWHQRQSIRSAMLTLQAVGGDVNSSCGFHVHHEWPWNGKLSSYERDRRLRRLRRLYEQCEPLWRAIFTESRWDNRYCDPRRSIVDVTSRDYCCPDCQSEWLIDHDEPLDSCGACPVCDYHDDGCDGCGCSDDEIELYWRRNPTSPTGETTEDLYLMRYVPVNFTALDRQNTVEFRQHQGTLRPSRALAWVELTRNLVHAASRPEVEEHDEVFFALLDKLSFATRRHLLRQCAERGQDYDELITRCAVGVAATTA